MYLDERVVPPFYIVRRQAILCRWQMHSSCAATTQYVRWCVMAIVRVDRGPVRSEGVGEEGRRATCVTVW